MGVGERIRAARTEREMSLSDLARATHLSKGFISQVESGTSNPSLESLRKLAEALNLPPGAFLDDISTEFVHRDDATALPLPFALSSGDITVHSPDSPGRMRGGKVVPLFMDQHQGTSALVSLSPHTAIFAPTTSQAARGTVLCSVLSGAVRITRAGVVAVVRQGQVASFDAHSSYELANRSAAQSTLLLTIPPSCALPTSVEPRVIEPRLPSSYPTGPLRLVEMRASRNLLGEQRR